MVPFTPAFLNLEYFFNKILELFRDIIAILSSADFVFWLKTILSLFTVFFITVILYSAVRIHEIRKKQNKDLKKIIVKDPVLSRKNEKWVKVLEHGNGSSPADWRLAIIEADTILDEMLQKMGHRGDNLGDRLKAVEPSDFTTLDLAWEAHKVRNRIAHEGSDFKLTREEAHRVLGFYEEVFREFEYI